MNKYTPINCDFYDLFEIHAMRKNWVEIKTNDNQLLRTKIKTLVTRKKEEFAILLGDVEIRLDEVARLKQLSKTGSVLGHLLDKLSFNRFANKRLLKLLENVELTVEVIRQMSHTINALDIWNKRILGQVSEFGVWQIHNPQSWNELLETAFIETVEGLNKNEIGAVIKFEDTEGSNYQMTVDDIVYHMINHTTYHRGQVIQLLQQSDQETVSTDYFYYLF